MGTRANIKLTQNVKMYNKENGTKDRPLSIWLYHHWDGYLSGLGAELQAFMIWYYQQPNNFRHYIEDVATALVKGKFKDNMANRTDIPPSEGDDGFEITTGQHGDIEYLYTITEYWGKRGITRVTLEAHCLYANVKGTLVDVDLTGDKPIVTIPTSWKELEDLEEATSDL